MRKPQPRRLGGGLWPPDLVGPGVGHRQRGAVNHPHPAALPPPVVWNRVRHQRAGLTRQRSGDFRRQALARFAIAAGVALARRQALGHPFDRLAIDGLLARAVRRQRLGAEHRQHLHRRKQSVAVRRGQRGGTLQQPWAGQQVEEDVGVGLLRAVLHLPLNGVGQWSAMHHGRPLRWQVPRSPPTVHPRRVVRCFSNFFGWLRLSQCHSGQAQFLLGTNKRLSGNSVGYDILRLHDLTKNWRVASSLTPRHLSKLWSY